MFLYCQINLPTVLFQHPSNLKAKVYQWNPNQVSAVIKPFRVSIISRINNTNCKVSLSLLYRISFSQHNVNWKLLQYCGNTSSDGRSDQKRFNRTSLEIDYLIQKFIQHFWSQNKSGFSPTLVQILSSWTVTEICSTIMGFYENSLDAVINIPFKSTTANTFTSRWLEIILFFCGASTKRSYYICRLSRSLFFDKKQISSEFFFFKPAKIWVCIEKMSMGSYFINPTKNVKPWAYFSPHFIFNVLNSSKKSSFLQVYIFLPTVCQANIICIEMSTELS